MKIGKSEIAELAIIQKVDVVTQQIIINGVPKNITQRKFVIACPNCSRVIYEFHEVPSEIEVIKIVNRDKDELLKIAQYCASCGTKLRYDREYFDGEFEENYIQEEENK